MTDTKDRTEERPDQDTPQAQPTRGHWREKKWIPGKNGRIYGPYLYERWRDGKICRSKYLGKVD